MPALLREEFDGEMIAEPLAAGVAEFQARVLEAARLVREMAPAAEKLAAKLVNLAASAAELSEEERELRLLDLLRG